MGLLAPSREALFETTLGIPLNWTGCFLNVLCDVQYKREQGHAHQYSIVCLPENCQIGMLVQIIVQFIGIFARIARKRVHDDRIGLTVASVDRLV